MVGMYFGILFCFSLHIQKCFFQENKSLFRLLRILILAKHIFLAHIIMLIFFLLVYRNLSGNSIRGAIPSSLGTIASLEVLWVKALCPGHLLVTFSITWLCLCVNTIFRFMGILQSSEKSLIVIGSPNEMMIKLSTLVLSILTMALLY